MSAYRRNEAGLVVPKDDNHPSPAKSKIVVPSIAGIYTVTHEMAGDWLDNRIPPSFDHQRKLSARKVETRAEEMNRGLWNVPVPPGLMFDTDGWNINGQHTLAALRLSRLDRLDMWIFPDQPKEAFKLIDTGYTRQARQLFAGPNATLVTSAVRYLGVPRGQYITRMSVAEQLAEVAKWPELGTHAPGAQSANRRGKVPASPHLAVLVQAERTAFRSLIPSWLDGVITGEALTAGDPRSKLRNRFIASTAAQRADQEANYNAIVKAWNAWVKGEKVQVLTWRENEGMIPVHGTEEW